MGKRAIFEVSRGVVGAAVVTVRRKGKEVEKEERRRGKRSLGMALSKVIAL